MTIHIRTATEADIPAIASVGCAAFNRDVDVGIDRVFPKHLQRPGHDPQIPWRAARKAARLRDPGSIIMVAVDRDEESGEEAIVGYAWWSRPGAVGNAGSSSGVSEAILQAAGETFPPELDREAMESLRAALLAGEKAVFGEQSRDFYELEILAVDPKHGRKGIGKRLVSWGIEKAALEKKDVFLTATPAGKPLYVVCGFEEVGSIDVFSVAHALMLFRNDPATRVPVQ